MKLPVSNFQRWHASRTCAESWIPRVHYFFFCLFIFFDFQQTTKLWTLLGILIQPSRLKEKEVLCHSQILMGGDKRNRVFALTALLILGLSVTFPCCFSAANQPQTMKKSARANKFGSSAVFPLHGNVYPLGYDFSHLFRFGVWNFVPFNFFYCIIKYSCCIVLFFFLEFLWLVVEGVIMGSWTWFRVKALIFHIFTKHVIRVGNLLKFLDPPFHF